MCLSCSAQCKTGNEFSRLEEAAEERQAAEGENTNMSCIKNLLGVITLLSSLLHTGTRVYFTVFRVRFGQCWKYK